MDRYNSLFIELHEKTIKTLKKMINFDKAYVTLCLINILIFTAATISSKTILITIINAFTASLWIFLIVITIKKIKKDKENLKQKQTELFEIIKIYDHPKYIKLQRIEKLKKLKKIT